MRGAFSVLGAAGSCGGVLGWQGVGEPGVIRGKSPEKRDLIDESQFFVVIYFLILRKVLASEPYSIFLSYREFCKFFKFQTQNKDLF